MFSSDISITLKLSLDLGNKYTFMCVPWNWVINYHSPDYYPESLDVGNYYLFMCVLGTG